MAFSLSNHSVLAPPAAGLSAATSLSSSIRSKTLESKTPSTLLHPFNRTAPPRLFSSISNSNYCSPINNKDDNTQCIKRRSFKSYIAAHDSPPPTNNHRNDVKASGNGAGQKDIPSLGILIKTYREAILFGDDNTVRDIEAKIKNIENDNQVLVQKVSALSAEITSGKEKYIRLQADFDNFRKRSEKDRLSVRSDAQGEVIESLLLMVDSFERAKQQIKPETEKEKKIDTSYQGIYKQLVEIMRSLQVAAVPTVGKPFDPSVHEAIAREESSEYKEGIVIQEFRRGFLLGNRLLRPAMVKVSAGPGSKKAPVGAEKGVQPATAAGMDER